MTEKQQIQALQRDLEKVIQRFRSEFDITYAAAIGVLDMIKMDLHAECPKEGEDE